MKTKDILKSIGYNNNSITKTEEWIAKTVYEKAIELRDEEIRKWIKSHETFYSDDLQEFLSTPKVKQPEKESDNFRINLIPEMSRKELEERSVELYDALYDQVEAIDFIRNDVETLRDNIEKCNESLDLVKDSDIIQMYGSIIGRLNLILNQ